MYCIHCGERVDDDSKFCTRCGKALPKPVVGAGCRVMIRCENRKKPTLCFCDGLLLGSFGKLPLVREIPAGEHLFAFYHAVGAFSTYAELPIRLDRDLVISCRLDPNTQEMAANPIPLEEPGAPPAPAGGLTPDDDGGTPHDD